MFVICARAWKTSGGSCIRVVPESRIAARGAELRTAVVWSLKTKTNSFRTTASSEKPPLLSLRTGRGIRLPLNLAVSKPPNITSPVDASEVRCQRY